MKKKNLLASGTAAALVTCWSIAPTNAEALVTLPSSADFTLSTDLSVAIENVQLIYGLNSSGLQSPFLLSIGSIATGPQSQTITLMAPDDGGYFFPDELSWGLIGTHGTDGVALAASSSFLDFPPDPNTWEGYFGDFLIKAEIRDYVVTSDMDGLFSFLGYDFSEGLTYLGSQETAIYNFSDITVNGPVSLALVPEPSIFVSLLGMAAFGSVLVRRRVRRS